MELSDSPASPATPPLAPQAARNISTDAAGDPRVFLAAERTFLAWIRTGLSLMGFGFILARFGIFLRQIQWIRENSPGRQFGPSLWLGVTLLCIGVGVNVAAIVRHVQLVRALREGHPHFNRPSRLAIVIAIMLACVGLVTAIYLVMVSMNVHAAAAGIL